MKKIERGRTKGYYEIRVASTQQTDYVNRHTNTFKRFQAMLSNYFPTFHSPSTILFFSSRLILGYWFTTRIPVL